MSKKIDKMTPSEICKYLNSGNHSCPLLMRYLADDGKEKYGLHYSERVGIDADREYRTTEYSNIKEAIKAYTSIILNWPKK